MLRPTHWRDDALCAKIMFLSPEEIDECCDDDDLISARNVNKAHTIFFPGHADYEKLKDAMAICERCPVQHDCLAFALKTHQKDGIWGGVSGRSRRRIQAMQNAIVRAGLFNDPEYALEVERIKNSEWQEVWYSEDFIPGVGLDDF